MNKKIKKPIPELKIRCRVCQDNVSETRDDFEEMVDECDVENCPFILSRGVQSKSLDGPISLTLVPEGEDDVIKCRALIGYFASIVETLDTNETIECIVGKGGQ